VDVPVAKAVHREMMLVERPQRPTGTPAVHIRSDAKRRPAAIQHIRVRSVAAEAMKTAIRI